MKLNAPLFNAVNDYRNSDICTFHMPGHRFGKGIPEEFVKNPFAFDVTEVPGTDNLHAPEGPIKEASRLAAHLFGARETFFLVNGSTVGIHAMITAACKPGDKILVPRNCHQSVIGGLTLAGAEPVYMKPGFGETLGVPGGVSPETVEEALHSNMDAIGALITSPTYYGHCSDIKSISEILHRYNKILMVDEAHGAHFCLSNRLPAPALSAGADVCVQSLHKTLPAATSAALLHIGTDRINRKRIESVLSILQTSSPSYITMVSIDTVRELMQNEGEKLVGRLLDSCSSLREGINQTHKLYCPGRELVNDLDGAIADTDLSRLVINVEKTGKTGYEVEYILREKHNIQIEMSDLFNLVCIPSIADDTEKFTYLKKALEQLAREEAGKISSKISKAEIKKWCRHFCIPRTAISLKEAFYHESEDISITKAEGRISSRRITPYPPGIPAVCPGEIIEAQMIGYLLQIKESGGRILGLDDEGNIAAVKE